MRLAIVVLLIIIIAATIQYQLVGINADTRREKCKVSTTREGLYRKATDYEYYSCLNKG